MERTENSPNPMTTPVDLSTTYQTRFVGAGLERRNRVWKTLCASFFQQHVPGNATFLVLACGYGEFINNIQAGQKLAVDLNPDSPKHLNPDVAFQHAPATDLAFVATGSVDRVFTSNFLEHLENKEACNAVFAEIFRVLKPGG